MRTVWATTSAGTSSPSSLTVSSEPESSPLFAQILSSLFSDSLFYKSSLASSWTIIRVYQTTNLGITTNYQFSITVYPCRVFWGGWCLSMVVNGQKGGRKPWTGQMELVIPVCFGLALSHDNRVQQIIVSNLWGNFYSTNY